MSRIKWYLKQLLSLTYRTRYIENGIDYFAVWQMWFGKCFNIERYVINTDFDIIEP